MTSNLNDDNSIIKRPRIALLGEEHWLFIRRQYQLSPRELQVAKLVCQGCSNDEIATDLKMRPGTVKTHMRNIYRRIRVGNKIEMLLKFVDSITIISIKGAINPLTPVVSIKNPHGPSDNITPSNIPSKK